MTPDIALVFAILAAAVVLFVTEWLRMDLVALLVLVTLGLTGLVAPGDLFAGFSNPAVITVWAMFVISGALTLTGVADRIGAAITRVAGEGEARLLVVIMSTAGLLSAVMNNVGVAALMLPVVVDVARRGGIPPSRLLMPLSFACLLGGLTTLIGTPPNILVSDSLRGYDLEPFGFFDFTPIGGLLLVAGILFFVLGGRHLLPDRDPAREAGPLRSMRGAYDVGEHLFTVRVPPDSTLSGRTLAQSRLGAALRLNVVAVLRGRRTRLAPSPGTVLQGGDRLLALGRTELADALRAGPEPLAPLADGDLPEDVLPPEALREVTIPEGSGLVGHSLYRVGLRGRFGVDVLAIRRGERSLNWRLQDRKLEAGDVLLVHGAPERLEVLAERGEGDLANARPVVAREVREVYGLHQRLLALRVPEGSWLSGRTLSETRLGDAFGLTVLAIRRSGNAIACTPDASLEAGDTLLAQGPRRTLETLRALRELEIVSRPLQDVSGLASGPIRLAEVVLSPQTTLEGRTLRELEFRERYGLSVLALWRRDRAYRTDLRDMELRFGDALLVHGPQDRIERLARDPDFVVVSETVPAAPRPEKGLLAVAVTAAVLLPVVFGILPIAIAAVTAATLLLLLRCLTMEEAYRFIEWPAVFLIAGTLPLGLALEQTGAARLVADGVVAATGALGPRGVLGGLFILAAVAKVVVPAAALAVIMIPIAFNAAVDLGVSPLPLLMTIAMAASASFVGPVAHPANTLILGPGGYRFTDYVKVGLPLTLLVFALVVLVVPVLWPFHP